MTAPSVTLLRDVHAKVAAHIAYRPDPKREDRWRSFADHVAGGQRVEGDCDDWAETAVELLWRAGVPERSLFRALVATKARGKIDHMVGLVCMGDGRWFSVGDTNAPPTMIRGKRLGEGEVRQVSRLGEQDENGAPRWRVWEPI